MDRLVVHGLTFGYTKRQEIFRCASLEFRKGVDLIMGPSGCGKTTLLKIMSGIIPVGEIEKQLPASRRLMVIQEDALLPWLTGWENMLLFLRHSQADTTAIQQHEAFAAVDGFLHQKAWQMSYGQRRAIELLRALISKPRILCLDEPLNYMDPDRRAVFTAAIYRAKEIEQILIATHESNDFVSHAEDALVFDGRHPVSDLKRRPLT